MADNSPGGLSNLMSAAQNIAKAIGQLNQTLGSLILTVANTWTALQTFSAGLIAGPGSALATSATSGFIFIGSCAGAPTGVPTGAAMGKIAMVYDTTNHKIWFYDPGTSTWKGVAVT